jgi:L-lactate dehydrogenase complex protein LldE
LLLRDLVLEKSRMRVGLFIPCYIDQFYPRVGMATVELLTRLGFDVDVPASQTCCGQPMANAGCVDQACPLALKFLSEFKDYNRIVCPSGSCVSMVRNHYADFFGNNAEYQKLQSNLFELCEFLTDQVQFKPEQLSFPFRVGLHASCHGLRELRLDTCSERVDPLAVSKVKDLLSAIPDIELVPLSRPDECCGFGGMFAVQEEALSVMMGRDRIADHVRAGAEVLTATDMSCLMHLQGILLRNKIPMKVMHVAEILAGYQPEP